MEHTFTGRIKIVLQHHFEIYAEEIFIQSPLIQYLNHKTRSAERGSKSRSSFANLYAIYVLTEDYVQHKFHEREGYVQYEGALYTHLLTRQRALPFGSKLQNHALNNRVNAEFQKFFPHLDLIPILRNLETNRYWINEHLLNVQIQGTIYNLATVILDIIETYIQTKQDTFQQFVKTCQSLQEHENASSEKVETFVLELLAPQTDARLFEIVSYAILKFYYHDQHIYWGYELTELQKETLKLYKTGRTNANDGGIDFVMKPLGRFFQVTETLDFRKYFLDLDKIQKYPLTFVVKSEDNIENLFLKIRDHAFKTYSIQSIVDQYLDCIEELINIPILQQRFRIAIQKGYLSDIMNEIILQSNVEFNYKDEINES